MARQIFEKHPRDKFWDFMRTMAKTLNPNMYHDFTQKRRREGLRYMANVILVSAVILAVLISFNLTALHRALDRELTKLNSFEVKFDLKEPIVIEQHKINITDEGNFTDQNILITDEAMYRRPSACLLIRPLCLVAKKPIVTDFSNFQEHKDKFGDLLFALLLLMIPGLIILYLLYMLAKALIIIFILSYLAKFICDVAKFRIDLKKIMLIAIYSSTVFILLEPVNLLVINTHQIHTLIFLVLFILGILLVGERKKHYHNI